MTYKNRIILLFILACSVVIGLFSIIIYAQVAKHTEGQFKTRLEERAILAAQVILEKDELNSSSYDDIVQQQLKKLPNEVHYIIPVDQNGEAILSQLPEQMREDGIFEQDVKHLDILFSEINNTLVGYLYYEDNQGNYFIVITATDRDGIEDLAFIKRNLLLMFFIFLGAVTLFAFLFATQILSPLQKIVKDIEEISANNLEKRLKVNEKQDQLNALSSSFNHMLERLQEAFENQKQFIHNASHEFRTPLTVILGETDFALSQNLDSKQSKDTLKKIQRQAEKLKKITLSLLEISELDDTKIKRLFTTFRFDELINERIELILEQNPSVKIQVNYKQTDLNSTDFECFGHQFWMEIAIDNLIENALKFSNFNKIEIDLINSETIVVAEIKDKGIGISEEELQQVTKAFYRGNNSYQTAGNGLGLSLVHRIIEIQNGSLNINSTKGKGTNVRIELPKN